MTGLSTQLAQRIEKEAEENDVIYRKRSFRSHDLSQIHYGHAEMLDWALSKFPNLRGLRVLDVGIGQGQSSVRLALAGAEVTGIEVSGEALKHARDLAELYGVKIDFQQMAGEDLHFKDQSFDAILCMSVYHHMNLEMGAREFARVLKPGGRLVMVEPLATNPAAWLYRRVGRFLSRESTSEETPLHIGDLRFLRGEFSCLRWRGKYLLSLSLFGLDRIWNNSNPLIHRITRLAFKWVSQADSALLYLPGLQRIAWKLCIVADR
jgi:2-polyprenyl-3-methyl-5-hydroxy-6-metoxy-1,4-benzoquinol methylase